MPISNLRGLEQRFLALEQRERKLQQLSNKTNAAAATGRRIHRSVLADPHLEPNHGRHNAAREEGLPLYANRYAVEETELLSGAKDEANAASKAVHGRVAQNVLSMKQKATAFFDRERGMRQAHLVDHNNSDLQPDMAWNDDDPQQLSKLLPRAGRTDQRTEDEVHFVPLFGRTPTPPTTTISATFAQQRPSTAPSKPAAGSGVQASSVPDAVRRPTMHSLQAHTSPTSRFIGADEARRESTGEDAIISRMVYSDDQARSAEGVAEAGPATSATAEAAAAGIRHASLRRVRPQTAQDSSYANARPIRVRRTGSANTTVSRQEAVEKAKAEERSKLNGQRLARAFFERLPPAVPPTGVASSATRYASRSEAEQAQAAPQRKGLAPLFSSDDASPGRASSNILPPSSTSPATMTTAALPPFALSPDYYRLQVKIVHSAATLAHWEFTVVITDVTNPKRSLPRHQFRGLKVNPQRHLIFQAPDGVTLDPLKQIPWAMSPSCLYNHTLRLEVFATHPLETKVVDTMVNYGGQHQ